jgi:hypothetical protein
MTDNQEIFVTDITEDEGIGTAMIGESLEDTGLHIWLFYGDTQCELAGQGQCADDGLVWSADDFGSPRFCTNHFFPQEQLGYEFVPMA